MKLTSDRLKQLLHYDPDTGLFTRKIAVANQRAGAIAGSFYRYCNICIDSEYYAAHRLAFLYMNDMWPSTDVDHINGDKLDNRWANLRIVTRSQNMHNRPAQRNNTSGFKGVYWNSFAKKWTSRLCMDSKLYNLGYFNTALEAHLAYERLAAELRGKKAA